MSRAVPQWNADTVVEVNVPIERVWAVISDLDTWRSWTVLPFRTRGRTPLDAGAPVWIGRRGGRVPSVLAYWTVVDEDRELAWGGELFGVRVRHGLILERLGDDRTRIHHAEGVDGWLARFLPRGLLPAYRGVLALVVNAGLRRYLETTASSGTPRSAS